MFCDHPPLQYCVTDKLRLFLAKNLNDHLERLCGFASLSIKSVSVMFCKHVSLHRAVQEQQQHDHGCNLGLQPNAKDFFYPKNQFYLTPYSRHGISVDFCNYVDKNTF